MLIRRFVSGKHILIWIGALLILAVVLLLGWLLLRSLVRSPSLASRPLAELGRRG